MAAPWAELAQIIGYDVQVVDVLVVLILVDVHGGVVGLVEDTVEGRGLAVLPVANRALGVEGHGDGGRVDDALDAVMVVCVCVCVWVCVWVCVCVCVGVCVCCGRGLCLKRKIFMAVLACALRRTINCSSCRYFY